MYTLHFGVLPVAETPTDALDIPRLIDEDCGIHVRAGRIAEEAFFGIITPAELSYSVLIHTDTWEDWGQPATRRSNSIHLSINTRNEPESREVEMIRRMIEMRVMVGRVCDWAVLTNAENWSQATTFYLWHFSTGIYPGVVPVTPA